MKNIIMLQEVMQGLSQQQKMLPSKLFYDQRGSELFDQICALDEYYLTRTEFAVMHDHITDVVALLGKKCLLIELGSGSSTKIRLLLDHLPDPAGYIAIDISKKYLLASVDALAKDYPAIKLKAVHADYTQAFSIPTDDFSMEKKVIYYPGSTIGNFPKTVAKTFLSRIASMVGKGSGLLIGVDLKKDRKILEAAYNDKKKVTAAFNLNLLTRLNRELGADFDLTHWQHQAIYNPDKGRVEMYLVSLCEQVVHLSGGCITFSKGEKVLTEYSYKYTIEEFADLLSETYRPVSVWTDKDNRFSLQYFVAV